jgi:hypothetical protein
MLTVLTDTIRSRMPPAIATASIDACHFSIIETTATTMNNAIEVATIVLLSARSRMVR